MKISKQILISLRGRLSARAFSQKLNYISNQISRWESGHSRISWSDFLDLSDRLQLPIVLAFKEMEYHGSPDDIKSLLSYFLPGKTSKEIAKICKVSAVTIDRWSRKKNSPPADFIFSLFLLSGTPLAPLLEKILKKKKMSFQLVQMLEAEKKRLSTMMETPWTIAIACMCLLEEVKGLTFDKSLIHVAEQINLEKSQIVDVVSRLIRARIIAYNEDKKEFYLPQSPSHFEFRNDFQSFMRGARFWAQLTNKMIELKTDEELNENHISYLVFNCQSESVKKIHGKMITLYKELAELSQNDENKGHLDQTFLFSMNLQSLKTPELGQLIKRQL